MAAKAARMRPSLLVLLICLFGWSLVLKIGSIFVLKKLYPESNGNYSYIGYDYPDEWPIDRPPVLMAFSHSVRFELDSPDGIAEWAAIIPGDGLVHLGEQKEPYTISMMHQLRCLDILREELVRERDDSEGPSTLSRHCLNYMKQMVMCRGDIELEPFQYPNHKDPIDMEGIYECRDWSAVYTEVEKNQVEFGKWLEQRA